MGKWSKLFAKLAQMFSAAFAGFEIHEVMDGLNHDGPQNQLVHHSIARMREEMSKIRADDTDSIYDLKLLALIILFGVFLAVLMGSIAAIYSAIAKRSTKKVEKELKA